MKKTMSPQQLMANRRNALKSTGPKTAAGKAVARMNALKHGLLAGQVVVRSHKLRESRGEFKNLCRAHHEHLAPVGPLEEMLVGQIVTATWRLRRARTAEMGEIALSVDRGWWEREKQDPLSLLLTLTPNPFSVCLVTRLGRSVAGCHYLIYCLGEVRQHVEREGELTEAMVTHFKKWLRQEPNVMVQELDRFVAWLAANPEKLEPEALRTRHKGEVAKYLDRKIRDLEFRKAQCEEREEAEERAQQSAAVLPSEAKLEKILRYETAIERQFFRALNQLERLQRRRQGEHVPPPMTIEVSTKT